MSAFWHWLRTSRYTQWLEDEVERLRAENRALTNSLLSTAGIQPIDVQKPVAWSNRKMSRHQYQSYLERKAVQAEKHD
jgi:hypothetical protein